eukprot:Awhi_evm1s3099
MCQVRLSEQDIGPKYNLRRKILGLNAKCKDCNLEGPMATLLRDHTEEKCLTKMKLIYDYEFLHAGTIVKVVASFLNWVHCIIADSDDDNNDGKEEDDRDDNVNDNNVVMMMRLPKSHLAPLQAPTIATFEQKDLIEMLEMDHNDEIHPLFTQTLIEEVTRELTKSSDQYELKVEVEELVNKEYQNVVKSVTDRFPKERSLMLHCLNIIYWFCESEEDNVCQLMAETKVEQICS